MPFELIRVNPQNDSTDDERSSAPTSEVEPLNIAGVCASTAECTRQIDVLTRSAGPMSERTVVAMTAHLRIVNGGTDDPTLRKSRLRVALADDHPELRRSLRRLLQAEPDIDLVGEAEDFPGAARQVRQQRPDVLVLDQGMLKGSSRERIQRLRERWPRTEIVVITMEKSPALAEQAFNAGAIGFVLKDTADVELAAALRDAARGMRYESPRLRQRSGQRKSTRG